MNLETEEDFRILKEEFKQKPIGTIKKDTSRHDFYTLYVWLFSIKDENCWEIQKLAS